MSDYRLDIKGNLGLSDFSNIYDYIGIVDYNDKFTLALNHVEEENIGIICEMLQKQNFLVNRIGKNEDGVYYIKACKN